MTLRTRLNALALEDRYTPATLGPNLNAVNPNPRAEVAHWPSPAEVAKLPPYSPPAFAPVPLMGPLSPLGQPIKVQDLGQITQMVPATVTRHGTNPASPSSDPFLIPTITVPPTGNARTFDFSSTLASRRDGVLVGTVTYTLVSGSFVWKSPPVSVANGTANKATFTLPASVPAGAYTFSAQFQGSINAPQIGAIGFFI